ncbi:MAG: site-specific integrase [Acidaminococcaceae bacterium]|nr:site-specific integrase [Acidaminococcaceae bacterium]
MPGSKQSLDLEALKKTGKCKWRLSVSNKFRADGKANRKTMTVGPCSEAQADKLLQILYLEFSKQSPQNANHIRFSEFAKIWLERHSKRLSPNTHNGYENAIEVRLKPYFGNIKITKISAEMIMEYINDLRANGNRMDGRAGTIASARIFELYKILRAMLNRAKEWGYITHNPIDDIPRDKRPRPHYKVKPILEDSQLSILLQKLFAMNENGTSIKNQLFIYLALVTGCRSGELLALSWNDINFESKKISITKDIYVQDGKTLVQNRTKGMTSRIVYVDDRCIDLLHKHKTYQSAWLEARKMKNPNQYIFIKRTTKANKTKEAELPCRECFHHFLSKFLKKNGLPHIDVHGLRRTAASYSISNQVPLTAIQAMLGHASMSTTMIYLRTLEKSRKEGVSALSNTYQNLMSTNKPDNKD